MKIFLDGTLTDAAKVSISLDDRAFRYGDGLFETMFFDGQRLRLGPYHWERLVAGAQALHFSLPSRFSLAMVEEQVRHLAREAGQQVARVRLHLWRGEGGLYTPLANQARYLVRTDAYVAPPAVKEKAARSTTVTLSPTAWSRFKTHNALPYVLASHERQQLGLDDLILTNAYGHVAEATYSNVFWKIEGVWYTPGLASGCLGGVMRRWVMEQIQAWELPLHEGLFPYEVLAKAQLCLLTNASGLSTLAQLDGHAFPQTTDPTVEALCSTLAAG